MRRLGDDAKFSIRSVPEQRVAMERIKAGLKSRGIKFLGSEVSSEAVFNALLAWFDGLPLDHQDRVLVDGFARLVRILRDDGPGAGFDLADGAGPMPPHVPGVPVVTEFSVRDPGEAGRPPKRKRG